MTLPLVKQIFVVYWSVLMHFKGGCSTISWKNSLFKTSFFSEDLLDFDLLSVFGSSTFLRWIHQHTYLSIYQFIYLSIYLIIYLYKYIKAYGGKYSGRDWRIRFQTGISYKHANKDPIKLAHNCRRRFLMLVSHHKAVKIIFIN